MPKEDKANIVRVMTSNELKALKVEKLESLIPENPSYCYKSIKQDKDNPGIFPIAELCPYWRVASDQPETLSGYCLFLEQGDWEEDGTIALFDQLKCCGVNNKWENLRAATKSSNARNANYKSKPVSGYFGVYPLKNTGLFETKARVNGKSIYIGAFKTAEEAFKARKEFDANHGSTKRHGESK